MLLGIKSLRKDQQMSGAENQCFPLQPAGLLSSVAHCTGYRATAEQAAEGLAALVSKIPGSILAPSVTHLHPK